MTDGEAPESARGPGWYPDPWQPGHRRYWDGGRWTADSFPETVTAAPAAGHWTFAPPTAPPPDAAFGPPTTEARFSPSDGPSVATGEWAAAPPPPPAWVEPTPERPLGPPEPVPPVTAPGGRGLQGFVAVLVVLALLAGFFGEIEVRRHLHHRPAGTTTPTTAPVSPATTAPTPSTLVPGQTSPPGGGAASASDPAHTVLGDMVLKQSDVPADATVGVVPLGNGLAAPTLDLCNGSFPSEALRSDRLQVAGVDGQGVGTLQTEAVLYKDAASASQALGELSKARAGCPSTPVTDANGQRITTRFNNPPDGAWAPATGVDRVAFDYVRDDGSGPPEHVVEVFLRRGRALLGIYFAPDAPQLPVTGQATLAGITGVFSQRVAQLPATAIGA